MEWNSRVRGLGDELISAWNTQRIGALPRDEKERLQSIVDSAGERSARAQGLGAAITDLSRVQSNGHLLYLAATFSSGHPGTTKLLGLLKVGYKKLFIRVDSGALKEIEPLCVLDFYVHESCQRSGIGSKLMAQVLREKSLSPAKLGYDRPSPKLMSFLKKHYGLSDYIPQSNNFVVFRQYWTEPRRAANSSISSPKLNHQAGKDFFSQDERILGAPQHHTEGNRGKHFGRRASPPTSAYISETNSTKQPAIAASSACHTTMTVTGFHSASNATPNDQACGSSEEKSHFSFPGMPRFGRRASLERHASPAGAAGGYASFSANQHQNSSPQAIGSGGYHNMAKDTPYQQYSSQASPTQYASPANHSYIFQNVPPFGQQGAASPLPVAYYGASPSTRQFSHAEEQISHQRALNAPAGFANNLDTAQNGHWSNYAYSHNVTQGHDRHQVFKAQPPGTENPGYSRSQNGMSSKWGYQEPDSLTKWQSMNSAGQPLMGADRQQHFASSRSSSAHIGQVHYNHAHAAPYSMPITGSSASIHSHHGPAGPSVVRLTPSKAMALRQQEGRGAKGALAW